MAFNSEMRKEKPKDADVKATEKKDKKATEKQLDQELKQTFPASDPTAEQNIVTGSRAKKPVLPESDRD